MKKHLTRISRVLRKNMTDEEVILWSKLRARGMDGYKFRRQALIGPYIVDFVCFEKNVIVELDGSQHALDEEKDRARDAWLEGEGFRVLRFWNNDVRRNLDGVLSTIHDALTDAE